MEIWSSFGLAFQLIFGLNQDLSEIVLLSLVVSCSAVVISTVIGLPLGALLAIGRFRGRGLAVIAVNALLALPPVVIGLLVYLMLSNAGPLGWLKLLYSPTAMIIAQTILVTPIVVALSREALHGLNLEYGEQLRSLGLSGIAKAVTLIFEARFVLTTILLAAFGRAISEVGAVIIVGGNINHLTRVMTTTIALETSKGDLGLALALGIILLLVALIVNIAAATLKNGYRPGKAYVE